MRSCVLRPAVPRGAALVAALSWWCASPQPAMAQTGDASTPAQMYERAQAKEQVARGTGSSSVKDIRLAATAYERIFRAYPTSGYADNAIWQAAGLLELAFTKSGDEQDREKAERWLEWLKNEYQSSPFAKKVDAELKRIAALAQPGPQTQTAKEPAPAPAKATDVATAPKPQDNTSGPATIRNVTTSPLPNGQRISIEFSREVQINTDRIDNPDRVFFDFKNAAVSGGTVDRTQSISGAFIKSVRIGWPSQNTTRLVLDLKGKPRYSSFSLYDPYRLVIDVVDAAAPSTAVAIPASTAGAAASQARAGATTVAKTTTTAPPRVESKPPAAASAPPATAPAPSIGRQLGLGVSRIVIDAGHGGHDPGAIANGVTEAELTLDIAQRLEKLLKESGEFQVVLTRDTDEFIALEERTAVATRHDADLFLSIHANASPDPSTRGVETYFLNIAGSQAEAEVAMRENASNTKGMREVPALTRAIVFNNKLKESREFATFVQTSMMRRLSVQNKALKDLGVKQAPFRVLIGADMPSVLAEVSFLTNKNEAMLLKQGSFRQRIATALYDAIVTYQGSLKKITTVASRDPQR